MYFGKKFEPPSEKVIHGAGQSPEQFKRYWDAVEKYKPAIYMVYNRINNIKEKFSRKIKEAKKISPALILQIGLNLNVKEFGDQCKQVQKGKYDEEIFELIKNIKGYKKPVFLRIGYEFNNPSHDYSPDNFISAWKHIVNLFKKQKCENVAFVWCACTAFDSRFKSVARIMEYYPGDEYVDWFGNDLFGVKHFKDSQDVVTEAFTKEAEKHRKPLMIGESSPAKVGVDKGKESWNEWFNPYFKWIKDHPVVKAFCYINWDWGKDWKQPEWLNGRIEENEEVRKRYVKELSNKKYLHLNYVGKLSK